MSMAYFMNTLVPAIMFAVYKYLKCPPPPRARLQYIIRMVSVDQTKPATLFFYKAQTQHVNTTH